MSRRTTPLFILSAGRSGSAMMHRLLVDRAEVEMHHEYLCTHVQRLAVKYTMGIMSRQAALTAIDHIYGAAVLLCERSVFGDSSNKAAWLVDLLSERFPNARFIHLVRDGRKVVSSFFHKLNNECYGDREVEILQRYVDGAPDAIEPPAEKKYWWNVAPGGDTNHWFRQADQFERICHHWAAINGVIEQGLKKVPDDRKLLILLEELVANEALQQRLFDFVGVEAPKDAAILLTRPHNVNIPRDFPLTSAQLTTFNRHCSDLMERYGYAERKEYRVEYTREYPHSDVPGTVLTDDRCILCGKDHLASFRVVPDSKRGLKVVLCEDCALVQSLPRIDHVPTRTVAVSGGADWGNVRYGKGFRTGFAMSFVQSHWGLDAVRTCLDVGANRGSFIQALVELNPTVRITAVEPDERVVDSYEKLENVTLINDRIERVTLNRGVYNFVYCAHTLEHLKNPLETLVQIRHAMAPGGRLFVEVPNIDFIGRDDVVEEWFIDKHLFHFSPSVFANLLGQAGFIWGDSAFGFDDTNIWALVQLGRDKQASPPPVPSKEVDRIRALGQTYHRTLKSNMIRLVRAAKWINNESKSRRVVVWGGGRIFDRLVLSGGLQPEQLSGVIDKNLGQYVAQLHGRPVLAPVAFESLKPELVIVASRAFHQEISEQIRQHSTTCEIMGLDALMNLEQEK